MGVRVLLKGFAPFVPWNDHQFLLMVREDLGEKLTLADMYRYSMAWLEASEAVLVLPHYQRSKGTLAEIKRAIKLGIPVYYSLEDLVHGTAQS